MRICFALLIVLGLFASRLTVKLEDDNVVVSDDDEDVLDDEEAEIKLEEEETSKPAIDDSPIEYQSPHLTTDVHFADHFDNENIFKKYWVKSNAKKDDSPEEISKYDGIWSQESPQRLLLKNDMGLVLKSKAKHAAISAKLHRPFDFSANKPLVVQYEVLLQEGQDCGGSYLKLLTSPPGNEKLDLTNFHDKTPYTIMFGPDKCGNDIKLHFIFRHTNPINGTITEKHCRKSKERLEEPFKDKQPHLYQLILKPDNTYSIKVDHRIVNDGSLFIDFTPPVNPSKEIDDPSDKKPTDWDEREKIPDPDAKKPDDWNEDEPPQIPDSNASKPSDWIDEEESMISDPSAIKPDDWDTDMDGEWEAPLITNPFCEKVSGCGLWKAPLIPNPEYKGKWRAPLIENPNYQGKWAPRRIPNPEFYEDLQPFNSLAKIGAIGIELWSMSNEILFDNIVVTDDEEFANEFAAQTYDKKRQHLDRQSGTLWERTMRRINYKPGYWTIYFIYVSIPFTLYFYYLYRRVRDEETFVNKMVNLTHENPWLWAVYVVLVGLPIAFLFYYICSPKKAVPKTYAMSKKTDESVPDDTEEQQQADNVEDPLVTTDDNETVDTIDGNEINNDNTKNETSPKIKKSDLDEPITTKKNVQNLIDNDDEEQNDFDYDEDEDDDDDDEEICGNDGFGEVVEERKGDAEHINDINLSNDKLPKNNIDVEASSVDSVKKRRQRKE